MERSLLTRRTERWEEYVHLAVVRGIWNGNRKRDQDNWRSSSLCSTQALSSSSLSLQKQMSYFLLKCPNSRVWVGLMLLVYAIFNIGKVTFALWVVELSLSVFYETEKLLASCLVHSPAHHWSLTFYYKTHHVGIKQKWFTGQQERRHVWDILEAYRETFKKFRGKSSKSEW